MNLNYEGNFDVRKDFYKGNLVPIEEIPYDEEGENDVVNAEDTIVHIK